jgi:hypothetical protein
VTGVWAGLLAINYALVIAAHLRLSVHGWAAGSHVCGAQGPYTAMPCAKSPGHGGDHRNARGWTWSP